MPRPPQVQRAPTSRPSDQPSPFAILIFSFVSGILAGASGLWLILRWIADAP